MTVRSHFITHLKKAYYSGQLNLPGELARFADIDEFERFCKSLGKEAWYCYTKPPFSSADKVVEYIGRYTHRVALSNHRIQSIDNNVPIPHSTRGASESPIGNPYAAIWTASAISIPTPSAKPAVKAFTS